jgi:hypothetical protein
MALGKNAALAHQLLSDTKSLLKGCSRAQPASQSDLGQLICILRYLDSFLDKVGTREVWRLVGPELYQWYFDALAILERRKFKSFHQHCLRLSNVLLLPVLMCFDPRQPILKMKVWSDERGRLILPQIDREFSFADRSRCAIHAQVHEERLKLSGKTLNVEIPIADLLMEMDGTDLSHSPRIPHTPIFLKQSGRGLDQALLKYGRDFSRIFRTPVSLRAIPADRLINERNERQKVAKLRKALDLVGQFVPELLEEVIAVTHAVSLVQGPLFVGGSDVAFHGVSFLNLDHRWSTITYADHLIHEAAHQVLHAHYEMNPLLKNATLTNLPSPIRSDRRPLYGNFHATFVFLRLTQFFEAVTKATRSTEARIRMHRHLLGFYTGMDILSEYAQFTSDGRVFFAEMRGEQERFRRVLPAPSPALYNRMGGDYERPSSLSQA